MARNTILLLLLGSAITMACAKIGHTGDEPPVEFSRNGTTKTQLLANVGSGEVSCLDVLAFSEEGDLVSSARSSTEAIEVEAPKCVEICYRLAANLPSGFMDAYARESDILTAEIGLNQCSSSYCPMSVSLTGRFVSDTSIQVQLERRLTKVRLERMTPVVAGLLPAGTQTRLTGAYLINVRGCVPIFEDGAATEMWYNLGEYDESSPPSVKALTAVNYAMDLNGPGPVDLGCEFLCCPNPSGNTRLVLELSVDGNPNYYPMTLPPLLAGKEYLIRNAVLTGYGSDDPDFPVAGESKIDFSISVSPWDDAIKEYEL